MRCEAPDTHFYAAMRDLNLEFLSLVAVGRRYTHGTVFGLDAGLVDPISRFSRAQLEAMAETPCLLAWFAPARGHAPARIAEPGPAADPEWLGHARLFAAGLLRYVLQMQRTDPLRAALCSATATAPVTGLAGLAGGTGFHDIRAYADRALVHLEARFRRQVRFWPDLVRAARDGEPERLQLARLSAIQLVAFDARRVAPAATAAPALSAALAEPH